WRGLRHRLGMRLYVLRRWNLLRYSLYGFRRALRLARWHVRQYGRAGTAAVGPRPGLGWIGAVRDFCSGPDAPAPPRLRHNFSLASIVVHATAAPLPLADEESPSA